MKIIWTWGLGWRWDSTECLWRSRTKYASPKQTACGISMSAKGKLLLGSFGMRFSFKFWVLFELQSWSKSQHGVGGGGKLFMLFLTVLSLQGEGVHLHWVFGSHELISEDLIHGITYHIPNKSGSPWVIYILPNNKGLGSTLGLKGTDLECPPHKGRPHLEHIPYAACIASYPPAHMLPLWPQDITTVLCVLAKLNCLK